MLACSLKAAIFWPHWIFNFFAQDLCRRFIKSVGIKDWAQIIRTEFPWNVLRREFKHDTHANATKLVSSPCRRVLKPLYRRSNLIRYDAPAVNVPINYDISERVSSRSRAADDDESYHVGQQTASWTFLVLFLSQSSSRVAYTNSDSLPHSASSGRSACCSLWCKRARVMKKETCHVS